MTCLRDEVGAWAQVPSRVADFHVIVLRESTSSIYPPEHSRTTHQTPPTIQPNETDIMLSPSQHQASKSLACQVNQMVIRKLQKALEADPEVDLVSQIPSSYSSRLADRIAKGLSFAYK